MGVGDDLTVHCIVRNEERWVWFAVRAALPFCERLLLWDTGSTDGTLEIVRQLASPKITFRQCGNVDAVSLTGLRNEMIRQTRTGWFAVVDGDEVWTPACWVEAAHRRREREAEVIVVPFLYPFPRLGYFSATNDDDFYIAGMTGSYSAKVFRLGKDVHWRGSYGGEEIRLGGAVVSRGDYPGMRVIGSPVWHMTLLERSSMDGATMGRSGKLHIDDPARSEFLRMERWADLPEVLFHERPSQVPNPFLAQCPQLIGLAPLPHEGCALL